MDTAKETLFILFSIPLYTILIGTEIIISNWHQHKYYSLRSTIENIFLTLFNASLDLTLRTIFYLSILLWCYQHRIYTIENYLLYWFLLFILEDMAFYFQHRIDHYCRIFWAVHVTHHSSEEFNLSTGFRSSALQPVYRFIYFIPIVFLGFHPMDIVFMYAVTQTYGILVHTQYVKKMPKWFEVLFVSPSHHRVHHASNIIYLDKNMGMCLIIWDKLFGTFQEELSTKPVKYGLTKPALKSNNPYHIIFHEWIALIKDLSKKTSFLNKMKYLFMPPGWSHDGSSQTANQMRKDIS